MESSQDIRSCAFWLAYDLDPAKGTSRVLLTLDSEEIADPLPATSITELVAALVPAAPIQAGQRVIEQALAKSVDTARYWQEPDGEDALAGLPEISTALVPFAQQILAAPSTRWWFEPRQAEQWAIDWRSGDDPAPLSRRPRQALATWGRQEREDEARAGTERPRDPHANYSGTWWSVPHGTIRSVGQIPLGLDLVEDSLGWEDATVVPLRGVGRTYEVRTEDDWVGLCRMYPLEVTASRRHDWFRVTGRDGRWVIPDWEQVAGRWDAVHLTVLAYLGTAGRALQVDDETATVLAGWDPDTTIWLTDVAREWEGPRRQWRRSIHQGVWVRISPQSPDPE